MPEINTNATSHPTAVAQMTLPGAPTAQMVMAAALAYRIAGLSIIPIAIDGSKRPAWQWLPRVSMGEGMPPKHSWKMFQNRLATEAEIHAWFSFPWGCSCGLAVVGGKVSGGLELIDFDTIDLFQPWATLVERTAPGLLDRLVFVESPRPGVHAYYRYAAEQPEGSQKLALSYALDDRGIPNLKTLIETKGEGGYALIPPSPPACHPTKRQYIYVTSRDLTSVQMITGEERLILLDAAKTFNKYQVAPPKPVKAPPRRPRAPRGDRPGDCYNARAQWEDILAPRGWGLVSVDSAGVQTWRRPGKSDGTSATVNYGGSDLLHVFSQNAHPFEAEKSYSKFAAFALLEHGGDFKAASRALEAAGYGVRRLQFGRRKPAQQPLRKGGRRKRR